MKRVAWTTDIHLNFLEREPRQAFFDALLAADLDGLLIGGDIGESYLIELHLLEMAEILRIPIYFVLGNHDFYRGSIADTRRRVTKLAAETPELVYLSAESVVPLGDTTALVGHDGWADARLGDFEHSEVLLNDYHLIEELFHFDEHSQLDRAALSRALSIQGDVAAEHFRRVLPVAFATHSRVVALTHVPPYAEACWHAGRLADDDYLPHFASQAAGLVMSQMMREHPERELLVLCGHTHGAGEAKILDNLHVLTGDAEYGKPVIARIFEFD